MAAGCQASRTSESPSPAIELTATQWLERLIGTYREATSYHDQAALTLSYVQDGVPQQSTTEIAVSWEAPNRLRVRAYQLELTSDGSVVTGRIHDAASNHLDRQLVHRPSPEKLTLESLLEDPLLGRFLVGSRGLPVQLELLLSGEPLQGFLEPGVTRELATPGRIDGRDCVQLVVRGSEGQFVLWIDRQSAVLRRLEYPASQLAPEVAANPACSDVQLVADFRSAAIGEPVLNSRFAPLAVEGFRQVEFFVLPPDPLPSKLFGQRPAAFSLAGPEGQRVGLEQMAGKITVLDWYTHDPACQEHLRQLQQVARQFAERPEGSVPIEFHAVCAEQQASDEEVREQLARWQVDLPLLRDDRAAGLRAFEIEVAPTLVILDAQGLLQFFRPAADPTLAEGLPEVLEALLRGDDLAERVKQAYQQQVVEYSRLLNLSGARPDPVTPVAPASGPAELGLETIWSREGLDRLGNAIFVASTSRQPEKLLVCRGRRGLLELDPASGDVRREVPLALVGQGGVTVLRSAKDGQGGQYLLGFQVGGRQVYLLDEAYQVLLSYPDAAQQHAGIADAQLLDLEADGQPELYVAFAELAGVHRVSLGGEREWAYRKLSAPQRLAASQPNAVGWRRLLVSCGEGRLHVLNQFGVADPAVEVPGQPIVQLFDSTLPGGAEAVFLGLSLARQGLAVGLDGRYREIWQYPLPAGAFTTDVQFATAGQFLGAAGGEGDGTAGSRGGASGQWILAGPDGSLNLIDSSGTFSDRWTSGHRVTGLTTLPVSPTAVVAPSDRLIVVSDDAVRCLQLRRRQ